MEEQINAILGNPEMMAQIMQMANRLGASVPQQQTEPQTVSAPMEIPGALDPGMLQKIASIAGSIGIDRDQRNLLAALRPYLSASRIQKLEKAMRAAKMARIASGFLNQGGLSLLTGR